MADMKTQLDALYELQQIDTGRAQRKRTLQELDGGAAAASVLQQATAELDRLRKVLQGHETQLRDRELQLKSAEDERKSRAKQAYGGTIADPKQLSALEKKIAELERTKSRLEDEILELMDKVEMAQTAVSKQEAVVKDLDGKAASAKTRSASDSERLRTELAQMKARREELVAVLDAPLLQQYETLLQRIGSPAVVAVRKGACTGCKLSLPSSFAPRLRAGDQVLRCESCKRILYLPSGESPFRPEEE